VVDVKRCCLWIAVCVLASPSFMYLI